MWFLYDINNFNKTDYDRCLTLMESDRKEKLLSGSHALTRDMSIFGEWIIKTELSKITGITIENIKLARTEKGKPYAIDIPYCFNISHCENLLAIAIDKKSIGVDIEKIKTLKSDVTKALCTQSDTDFLNSAENEQDALIRFYKIWTAKEAYFKMLGSGITNLKSINYCDLNPKHYLENDCIVTIITE
ncbi:MAG: 4'-phosphopantetheinyl transferase superfamily protein [Clostridia bacterium]|nr:4'-phosphopantetheinyl transferase superfamily protein [Clostridia bacterium]